MDSNQNLRAAFEPEALSADISAPDDFMHRVWQEVGKLEEVANQRKRSLLGLGIFAIALGGGFATVGAPAYADSLEAPLVDDMELSPSSLLHL